VAFVVHRIPVHRVITRVTADQPNDKGKPVKVRKVLANAAVTATFVSLAAVGAAGTAQAAGCTSGRLCVWSDSDMHGTYGAYATGVPVLPASLDRKISSVKAWQNVSYWVFYAEQNYVRPVFCIGASASNPIYIHDLAPWGHNDQFRSMRPMSVATCPAP
jgi:hypothetical protein